MAYTVVYNPNLCAMSVGSLMWMEACIYYATVQKAASGSGQDAPGAPHQRGVAHPQVMAASFGPSMDILASAGAQKLAIAGANPALACGALSARLQGAMALVLRGNCTFSTKVGAAYLLTKPWTWFHTV